MPVYYKKEKKLWYIKVVLGGKYFYCYSRIDNGESFQRKRDAQQYEPIFISTLTDVARKTGAERPLTCDDLFPLFLGECKLRVKPSTYTGNKYCFEKHIAPFFKGMEVAKVNNAYLDNINMQINRRKANVRIQVHVCRKFIKYLRKTRPELDVDRVFLAKNSKPRECDYKIYSEDQFKAFLAAIDDEGHRFLFTLLFYYGLRIGEALALRWSDFYDGQCHIRRSMTRFSDENGKQLTCSPKTRNSIREYPIVNAVSPFVEGHPKTDAYCFPPSNQRKKRIAALSYSEVRRLSIKYAEKAGLFRIRIHEFRHSCVSWLLSNGMNYRTVARWVGDTESVVLSTYSHLIPGEKDQIAIFLNGTSKVQKVETSSTPSA